MKTLRQGDILLQTRQEIPKGFKKSKDNILVYGESTGHKHVLQGGDVYRDINNAMFLNIKDKALLVHEEHKPLSLSAGKYAVIRQREYVSSDMTKIVVD